MADTKTNLQTRVPPRAAPQNLRPRVPVPPALAPGVAPEPQPTRGWLGNTRPAAAPRASESPAQEWLRILTENYPDFKYDGLPVNPKTGKVAKEFSLKSLSESVYRPPGVDPSLPPLYFVPGANQWKDVAAPRAERHARTLGLPIGIVHNASLVQEAPGMSPEVMKQNRTLENIGNALIKKDMISERSVKNLALTMKDALETGKPAYFGGESQGSMLVGQALNLAKYEYVSKQVSSGSKDEKTATAEFEAKAGKYLNIVTFGNGYEKYPKGPNYLHISMKGDPIPQMGTNPRNTPADAKTQYLEFDQIFPGNDNFENHNISFLTQLLKRTSELNGLKSGDLPALFQKSQEAQAAGRSLIIAKPGQVTWPADMRSVMWNEKDGNLEALQRLQQSPQPAPR
jgi:hypothetical protein